MPVAERNHRRLSFGRMIRSRRTATLALAALVNGLLPISASHAQKQSTFQSASVPFSGTELFGLIQGGQNRKTTWATLAEQATAILPFGYPVNAKQIPGAGGLKCDDTANDTAALVAILNYWNSSLGANITMPPGKCQYDASSLPAITAKGGGLFGQGASSGTIGLAPLAPVGTVLRNRETTTSDLVFSTANYATVADISFYPVNHKTGGCGIAVSNNNNASASGSFNKFDSLLWFYPYYAVCDHAGTYNRYIFPSVFDGYSRNGWIWISGGTGTAAAGGGGIYIDRCLGYSTNSSGTNNLPAPGAAFIKGGSPVGTAYVGAGTTMNLGDFVYSATSGAVLVVSRAGVTANGGTGPALPTWTTASSISNVNTMTDGTVGYAFYQFADAPYLHIDSNGHATSATDCKVTQTGKFVLIDNSLNPAGTPPHQTNIDHEEGNSFWQAAIDVQAGGWHHFRAMDITNVVTDSAVKIGTATLGSGRIDGIFQSCLGPCIDVADNHVAANNNGEEITGIVAGNAISGGGAALRIANAGTVVGCGAYGAGGFESSFFSKYGIEFASTATDYHVAPCSRVKGSTSDFNNLSTNDGEGVPIAWTPDLKFGGSNTGITYGGRTGSYIRYGKEFVANFTINLTSKGAQPGTATITGFPLVVGANSAPLSIQGASNLSGVGAGIGGVMSAGGGQISPQTWGATGLTGLADTNFTNNGNLLGTVTGLLQ
jgi:hypothetical protein